jgi:hypothetical protein
MNTRIISRFRFGYALYFCNENVHTARGRGRGRKNRLEIIKTLMTQYQMQWAYYNQL